MDTTSSRSFPSNLSLHQDFYYCNDPSVIFFFLGFAITRTIIILPFAILVLYQAHRRWREQHSFRTTSQSDLITYHIAVIHLLGVPGLIVYTCGFSLPFFFFVGTCVFSVLIIGELLFHVLTCVERYLAVVHPITYLQLKSTKGAKIRRLCIGGVWLFSFGWITVLVFYVPDVPVIPFLFLVSLCFTIVSFCSLSVLCALIRPGPGEAAGNKEHTDQSKQKAFHTIMVITAALWLQFTGYVVCVALEMSELLSHSEKCWVVASTTWFSLPSSLVVPLLFLHRAGKLRCCSAGAE